MSPDQVAKAIEAIAKNELPPKDSVLAPEKSVCDECPRKKEDKKISKIHRVYEITPDPERCLLEQGTICMGPATRGGCGAQCIKANMPCTGCGGPCPDSPPAERNIRGVIQKVGLDIAKEVIKHRAYGQKMTAILGGKAV